MKIVYLDEFHWITLSKAAHGRASSPEAPAVLKTLRQAQASGRTCFPLSYGHYVETRKHSNADGRQCFAELMLELSGGMTIAPPTIVVCHEIEVTLGHHFPGRVVPEPFHLLGRGLAHALGCLEEDLQASGELTRLSGRAQEGESQEERLLTDLTVEGQYGASLGQWAGARSSYASTAELKREIYTTNFSEIERLVQAILAHHHIPYDEFTQLSESQQWALLGEMPWQRADMHLKRQWEKNATLKPSDRHSDLIDWSFLSLAVSYCDIVVTEKHMTDMYARDHFKPPAAIISQLGELPELLA
jgi:hypothetical protein